MKSKQKLILSSLLIFTSLVCMFFFRKVPSSRLWQSYDVIYIDSSFPESTVLEYLEKYSCYGTISKSNQRIPDVTLFAPVQPSSVNGSPYLEDRNKYFSDKDKLYSIYYVPSKERSAAISAIRNLITETGVSGGFDSGTSFPLICPLVVLLIAFLFFLNAENKKAFILPAVLPVLYTLAFPFYVCAAAAALLLLPLFLVQKILFRQHFFKAVFANHFVVAFLVMPVPVVFCESVISGVFYVVTVLLCLLSLLFVSLLRSFKDSKLSFTPVYILSASNINILSASKRGFLFVPALTGLFIFFVCIAGGLSILNVGTSKVQLPAPSSNQFVKGELPVFSDYLNWCWNAVSLPYRSMNKTQVSFSGVPQEGEKLYLRKYSESNGKIVFTDELVLSYDEHFRKNMSEHVKKFSYPAIEKLLESNSTVLSVTYSNVGQGSTSGKSVVLLLILIAVPFSVIVFGIIPSETGKKSKKRTRK